MMAKITSAMALAMLKLQQRLNKLADEEDGMETLEVVILIAVAVIIAGIIINVLQGDDGFIKKIFDMITQKLEDMF